MGQKCLGYHLTHDHLSHPAGTTLCAQVIIFHDNEIHCVLNEDRSDKWICFQLNGTFIASVQTFFIMHCCKLYLEWEGYVVSYWASKFGLLFCHCIFLQSLWFLSLSIRKKALIIPHCSFQEISLCFCFRLCLTKWPRFKTPSNLSTQNKTRKGQ